MGKTTYLQNRFNKDNGDLKDEYIAFHLFPVNYVVSDNKDIFELIKFDLLYQLLDYVDFEELLETDSIYRNHLTEFVSENYSELFFHFLTSFPLFGGYVEKIKSNLESLVKKFKDSKPQNAVNKVNSFIDEIVLQKGSIYENDFYTKLIFGLIEEIKNKSQKETVLIIDDLDRIDPNHIFRILNIFSAHIDCNSLMNGVNNKFNIDKVIVVGDYNNIKSIFHHVYGNKTDFSGYIDKFYSTETYQLSFEDKISDILFRKFNDKEERYAHFLLKLVLSILHDNDKFNLRQFHKLDSILENYSYRLNHTFFEILLTIYNNDLDLLINNLEYCSSRLLKFNRTFEEYDDFYLKIILKKLPKANLNFVSMNSDSNYVINIKGVDYIFKENINSNFSAITNNVKLDFPRFWYLMIEVFRADNFYGE